MRRLWHKVGATDSKWADVHLYRVRLYKQCRREGVMSMSVLLCEAYGANDYICGAENEEWEDRDNWMIFTCVECGAYNKLIYKYD
jgi:hypothetical protein